MRLREGNDLAVPVNNMIDKVRNFFKGTAQKKDKRKGPRMVYKNTSKANKRARGNAASDSPLQSHQERIDSILEKIKQSGMESLSEEEKDFLFNASKK